MEEDGDGGAAEAEAIGAGPGARQDPYLEVEVLEEHRGLDPMEADRMDRDRVAENRSSIAAGLRAAGVRSATLHFTGGEGGGAEAAEADGARVDRMPGRVRVELWAGGGRDAEGATFCRYRLDLRSAMDVFVHSALSRHHPGWDAGEDWPTATAEFAADPGRVVLAYHPGGGGPAVTSV